MVLKIDAHISLIPLTRGTLRFLLVSPLLFNFHNTAFSQKVFTTIYKSQANVILYETDYRSEADVVIYKVQYSSQADADKGMWYDVKYRSEADWIVYWTKYRSEADCVVYFARYRSEAKRNDCFLEGKGR